MAEWFGLWQSVGWMGTVLIIAIGVGNYANLLEDKSPVFIGALAILNCLGGLTGF